LSQQITDSPMNSLILIKYTLIFSITCHQNLFAIPVD
jgi:hypothetical protein